MIDIRLAREEDVDAVWRIFARVVGAGDTYAYDPGTSRKEFRSLWFGAGMKTFVAYDGSELLGTYILKPNQPGLGSHIANAGYMVAEQARGKGVGSAMCAHSIETAKALGYRGMQFNLVVATNKGAVELWKKFSFEVIGTVPGAFRHSSGQFVDAHIMYRAL